MQQKLIKTPEFSSLGLPEQIVECFYKRASELTKVSFFGLNARYPSAERAKNPKLDYLYQDAFQQAKFHRNHHKNVVKDSIVPLAKIKKHATAYIPEETDKATIDFRKLILGQFDMLYTRLVNYADLLIDKNSLPEFLITLERVHAHERLLLESGAPSVGIAYYSVTPAFTKEEDFIPKQIIFKNLNAARTHYGVPEVHNPSLTQDSE